VKKISQPIADAVIPTPLNAEYPGPPQPARGIPAGVKPVEICVASGDLPDQWCPQKGRTWFIPGKSPIRVSSVHRPLEIRLTD
jgi:penicillin-binding protein 1C